MGWGLTCLKLLQPVETLPHNGLKPLQGEQTAVLLHPVCEVCKSQIGQAESMLVLQPSQP